MMIFIIVNLKYNPLKKKYSSYFLGFLKKERITRRIKIIKIRIIITRIIKIIRNLRRIRQKVYKSRKEKMF